MEKILFVCTGNTCRSPMAEAVFNKLAKEYKLDIVAESAGLDAAEGAPPSENAILACKEKGMDISLHKARNIKSVKLDEYINICVMNYEHADRIINDFNVPVNRVRIVAGGDRGIQDPFGYSLPIYRACLAEIKHAIESYLIANGHKKSEEQ